VLISLSFWNSSQRTCLSFWLTWKITEYLLIAASPSVLAACRSDHKHWDVIRARPHRSRSRGDCDASSSGKSTADPNRTFDGGCCRIVRELEMAGIRGEHLHRAFAQEDDRELEEKLVRPVGCGCAGPNVLSGLLLSRALLHRPLLGLVLFF